MGKPPKHITEHISVTIFDDELIVGRPNTWLGRYTLVYPELDGSLFTAATDAFQQADQAGSRYEYHRHRRGPKDHGRAVVPVLEWQGL